MSDNVTSDHLARLLDACEKCAEVVTAGRVKPVEQDDLVAALNRDTVAEVEDMFRDHARELYGSGVRQDLVMLGHAARANKHKNQLLEQADDTTLSEKLERYHRIIGEMGFEKVLELDFDSDGSRQNEKFYCFWRNGMLLAHDTFYGNVNGGNVYFNWKPLPGSKTRMPERCSGGLNIKDKTGEVRYNELFPTIGGNKTTNPEVLERERLWNEKWEREAVFVGSCDCREALRFRTAKLEQEGTILPVWEFRPWLWLLHHGDTKVEGYDHKKITAERIAMLPEYVRKAITPQE